MEEKLRNNKKLDFSGVKNPKDPEKKEPIVVDFRDYYDPVIYEIKRNQPKQDLK